MSLILGRVLGSLGGSRRNGGQRGAASTRQEGETALSINMTDALV